METAQQYREAAAKNFDRAQESFERCDTDGFLSQWASDLNGRTNLLKAEVIENGGKATFVGLYEGSRRVAAKEIQTNYGTTWILSDEEASKFGRKFVPIGSKSRIQKQLGLTERDEEDSAWVTTTGNMTSCRPIVFRTGDKWGADATLLV